VHVRLRHDRAQLRRHVHSAGHGHRGRLAGERRHRRPLLSRLSRARPRGGAFQAAGAGSIARVPPSLRVVRMGDRAPSLRVVNCPGASSLATVPARRLVPVVCASSADSTTPSLPLCPRRAPRTRSSKSQ
jgi:hypothetical protein